MTNVLKDNLYFITFSIEIDYFGQNAERQPLTDGPTDLQMNRPVRGVE